MIEKKDVINFNQNLVWIYQVFESLAMLITGKKLISC